METPKKISGALALAAALGLCAIACGSEPQPGDAVVEGNAKASNAIMDSVAKKMGATVKTLSALRIDDVRFEPERPTTGEIVRAIVEVENRDTDSLWYRYAWTLDGDPVDIDNTPRISLKGVSKGTRLELEVTARDGKAESLPAKASIWIRNAHPRIERVAIEPSDGIVVGTAITARPEARDADGDELTFRYEWTVDSRRVHERGPVLSTDRLRRDAVVRVSVMADDGDDKSEWVESADVPIGNSPPRITSRPGAPSNDGVFRYQVVVEDPDGDSDLRFELEKAPEGMSIDPASGSIAWQPGSEQSGTYAVSVIVDDRRGGRSQQTIEVVVNQSEDSPPPARRRRR